MLSLVLYMRTTLYTQLACLEPEPKVAQVSPFIWALAGGGKDGTNLTTTLQQRQRRRRQWLEKRREKRWKGCWPVPVAYRGPVSLPAVGEGRTGISPCCLRRLGRSTWRRLLGIGEEDREQSRSRDRSRSRSSRRDEQGAG
jgi:hypothetical protein